VFEPAGNTADSVANIKTKRAAAEAMGGSLVIETASANVLNEAGTWGTFGNASNLMARIKQQLDPDNILSPGTFNFENVTTVSPEGQ
jgi:glycolate oxidase FAD binding subunit